MPTGGETSSGGNGNRKGNRKGKRKERSDRWDDGFGRKDARMRSVARADQRYPLQVLASFPAWALRKELRRREGGSDTDMGVRYKGRRRYMFGRGSKTGMWPSKKWASRQAAKLYPVELTDADGAVSSSVVDTSQVPGGSRYRVGYAPTSGMWPSKKWASRQAVGLSPVPTELAGVSAFDTFR